MGQREPAEVSAYNAEAQCVQLIEVKLNYLKNPYQFTLF
jgi:hypothetical protein